MFTTDDLYLTTVLDERSRERAVVTLSRQAQILNQETAVKPAPIRRVTAAQRTLQMLSELYGQDKPYGADPALFYRLAWVGIED